MIAQDIVYQRNTAKERDTQVYHRLSRILFEKSID